MTKPAAIMMTLRATSVIHENAASALRLRPSEDWVSLWGAGHSAAPALAGSALISFTRLIHDRDESGARVGNPDKRHSRENPRLFDPPPPRFDAAAAAGHDQVNVPIGTRTEPAPRRE